MRRFPNCLTCSKWVGEPDQLEGCCVPLEYEPVSFQSSHLANLLSKLQSPGGRIQVTNVVRRDENWNWLIEHWSDAYQKYHKKSRNVIIPYPDVTRVLGLLWYFMMHMVYPKYMEYSDVREVPWFPMYLKCLECWDYLEYCDYLEYWDYLEYFLSLCSSHKLHPCPTLAST